MSSIIIILLISALCAFLYIEYKHGKLTAVIDKAKHEAELAKSWAAQERDMINRRITDMEIKLHFKKLDAVTTEPVIVPQATVTTGDTSNTVPTAAPSITTA